METHCTRRSWRPRSLVEASAGFVQQCVGSGSGPSARVGRFGKPQVLAEQREYHRLWTRLFQHPSEKNLLLMECLCCHPASAPIYLLLGGHHLASQRQPMPSFCRVISNFSDVPLAAECLNNFAAEAARRGLPAWRPPLVLRLLTPRAWLVCASLWRQVCARAPPIGSSYGRQFLDGIGYAV